MSGVDTPSPGDMNRRGQLVWDVGVRAFHWLTVCCFAISWISAEMGNFAVHRIAGFTMLGLVLFRIGWGIWGGETARFSQFVRGPSGILAYLPKLKQREPSLTLGHNPLGGLSIAAILTLLFVQAGLGLFAVDVDFINSGPLAYQVSFEAGRQASEIHEFLFNILLILVGLHLAAIAFYYIWKAEDLIGPMIWGRREKVSGSDAKPGAFPLFLLTALGAAALVALIVTVGPSL